MGVFKGITFPEWQGDPPCPQQLDYDQPTELLPLEASILARINPDLDMPIDLSRLRVASRRHTVVGHYSDFAGAGQGTWSSGYGVGFVLENDYTPLGSVLHFTKGVPASLEIYSYGDDTFPSQGILSGIAKWESLAADPTAVTSGAQP